MNPNIAMLIKNYKNNNDEDSLLEIWERLQPLVLKYMRKFNVTSINWEDTSQEIFIKLLKCAEKYDPSNSVPFESYFKIQLHYFFLNRCKKRKPDLLIVDYNWEKGISMINFIESDSSNIEDIAVKNNIKQSIERGLQLLTDKQRIAIDLFYLQGIPMSKVADILECSYKVAHKHKTAGLKKLRNFMKGV